MLASLGASPEGAVLDDRSRASFVAVLPEGEVRVRLPITGRHHVRNALLALAAALAAGVDPGAGAAALAASEVSTGRGRVVTTPSGGLVVDDSYNANPTSVLAALRALDELAVAGRRMAVLGVMAEIGATHDADHRRVGAAAAEVVDRLVVVGSAATGLVDGARAARADLDVTMVDHVGEAVAALGTLRPDDAVLVKGSRVAGLERVVAALVDDDRPADTDAAVDAPGEPTP